MERLPECQLKGSGRRFRGCGLFSRTPYHSDRMGCERPSDVSKNTHPEPKKIDCRMNIFVHAALIFSSDASRCMNIFVHAAIKKKNGSGVAPR